MIKAILITFITLTSLTACIGEGYPGETPNLDVCNPGHETSKDCPNRRHINP